MNEPPDLGGQLYTLGLPVDLRTQWGKLRGASSDAYFHVDRLLRELANPSQHDLCLASAFRVELWDRYGREQLR